VGQVAKGSTLFMTHSPSAINQVAAQLRTAMSGRAPGEQGTMKR
jgi:hypothetical protein